MSLRPEVAPLVAHAQAAIRRSLEARMKPKEPAPPSERSDELTPEEKAQLEAHYLSLK